MSAVFTSETVSMLERDKSYLKPTIFEADKRVRQALSATGVIFISPLATLCNEQGCLLVVPNGSGKPMAWDESHLTRSGSIDFVSRNAAAFTGP
jgi:hypothetical protein